MKASPTQEFKGIDQGGISLQNSEFKQSLEKAYCPILFKFLGQVSQSIFYGSICPFALSGRQGVERNVEFPGKIEGEY